MFAFSKRRFAAAVLSAILLPAAAASDTTGTASPRRVEAELLDGTHYSLGDSRSGLTVLSFWSPDSLASRKCIWELQRFASAYESRGVATVAVSTLKDTGLLSAFVAKRKLQLPVAILEDHDLGALPEHLMPIVHVFDKDGRLLASRAGLYSYRSLEALVVPLLK